MNSMQNQIELNEKLVRAIWPFEKAPALWFPNGQIQPAAFRDPRGCSVVRTCGRDLGTTIESMHGHFQGYAAVVTVADCKEKPYVPPEKLVGFHAELHQSKTCVALSMDQCYDLAEAANSRGLRPIW